jgi:hypothetical protein
MDLGTALNGMVRRGLERKGLERATAELEEKLAEVTGEFGKGKVAVEDLVENEPGDTSDVEVPQDIVTVGLLLGLKGVERPSSKGVERQGSEWSRYLLTSGMIIVGGPPDKSKVLRKNTIKSDLPTIPDEEGEIIKPFAFK